MRCYLPRHRSPQKVHQHISQRLDVVPPRLLDAQVCVDGCVSGRAGQVLVLPVWDVDMGLGVPVFFRQSKVNDIDLIRPLAQAHQEVVGLDIPVDEALRMDILDTRYLHALRTTS